jgi:hypothetical protein
MLTVAVTRIDDGIILKIYGALMLSFEFYPGIQNDSFDLERGVCSRRQNQAGGMQDAPAYLSHQHKISVQNHRTWNESGIK